MTSEERHQRIAAMTEEVRRQLLARCVDAANAEVIDTAAFNVVIAGLLDAHIRCTGARLPAELEAQYASAVHSAGEALATLGIANPLQPLSH
jgi:hypothetical protein